MDLKGVRLCLVGPLPPPAGGMAVLTRQLGDLLGGEGLAVRLVQVNAAYRPSWIGRVKGLRALFRLLPYLASLWREVGRAQLVHVMANSGWSWHLYAAPALAIAEWRGVPVVVNYHGGEAEKFLEGSAVRVRRRLRGVRSLLVPSNFLVEVFGRHGIAARVLPNVVDLSRFSASMSYDHNPESPHLIVARNLEFVYGVDIAIKAFAHISSVLPHARLTLAGSGPARAEFERLARELEVDDRVSFPGRLDRDQMSALFQRSDLLLNPSRADNQPVAVLEAMASGVPIVATAVGGVPYMLENERTALLVPSEDPRALAAAALSLLLDTERARTIAHAAQLEVQGHDWTNVRRVLFNEYRQALGLKLESSQDGARANDIV